MVYMMPIYKFEGINKNGKKKTGLMEADSIHSLRVALNKNEVFVTKIIEKSKIKSKKNLNFSNFLFKNIDIFFFVKAVSVEDKSVAIRQFSILLKSGVPIIEALIALIEQIENSTLKEVFRQIKMDIKEGSSLAEAMSKHKYFSSIFINMIHAGESSGSLDVVLEQLADFSEMQFKLKSKITYAMIYPSIIFIVAFIVLIIMFTFVVPKIVKIFDQVNASLPLITEILIKISSFTKNHFWFILIVIISLFYLFFYWKKTPNGKLNWDKFCLSIPVFGQIIVLVSIARFARILSTLLSNGIPLLTSLCIVKNVIANNCIKIAVDIVKESVEKGENFSTSLKKSKYFPPMVIHMLIIGEKSGRLEDMLKYIADSYEQMIESKIAILNKLLEPIMILFMGGIVAFIVFSILLPIMQMNRFVR